MKILLGLALTVILHGVATFTVTLALHGVPPPEGLHIAVYSVVIAGKTLILLPEPAPLSQVTEPPVQPL